jgi:hypothetical protein
MASSFSGLAAGRKAWVALTAANRYIGIATAILPGTTTGQEMRAETEKLVEDIRQSVGLLRRHL